MKSREYPTAEDDRPVTGSCLDQIPVEEVDWREYFAELDEEERLGHPLALGESIQFGYRASSLTPEEIDHQVRRTMEMLPDLACGIDVNRPKN